MVSKLSAMGMPLAFDSDEADFSGMGGEQGDISIGEVIHKTFIKVNERGTEAAAATGVIAVGSSREKPPVIRADHPFLFVLRDRGSGAILFMGRVVDPRAEPS